MANVYMLQLITEQKKNYNTENAGPRVTKLFYFYETLITYTRLNYAAFIFLPHALACPLSCH